MLRQNQLFLLLQLWATISTISCLQWSGRANVWIRKNWRWRVLNWFPYIRSNGASKTYAHSRRLFWGAWCLKEPRAEQSPSVPQLCYFRSHILLSRIHMGSHSLFYVCTYMSPGNTDVPLFLQQLMHEHTQNGVMQAGAVLWIHQKYSMIAWMLCELLIFYFLLLEATTLFWYEWSHEDMRLHVLTDLWILDWGSSFHLLRLHLRQETPQKFFCFQNIYNNYGNLPHLWICCSYQLPGYHLLFSRGNIFRGPTLLSITIISTCLSDFHLSVSGVFPLFPFGFIKNQLPQCVLNLWSRTPASKRQIGFQEL